MSSRRVGSRRMVNFQLGHHVFHRRPLFLIVLFSLVQSYTLTRTRDDEEEHRGLIGIS